VAYDQLAAVDPDAIDAVTRVPHGGESNPELVDFSANTNPRRPGGVARVYEAALAAAGRYPGDEYYAFRAAAAEYIGVTGTEIIPTAGGLAGMRLLCSIVIDSGDSVAIPNRVSASTPARFDSTAVSRRLSATTRSPISTQPPTAW